MALFLLKSVPGQAIEQIGILTFRMYGKILLLRFSHLSKKGFNYE